MAIQSLTDLKALINSTIQDNTTNDISGSDVQTALINAIDTLDSLEGFINVHKANGQTTITAYGSKALARAAVPDDCKKEGVVIAYKISTGWLIEQNLDATAGTWGDDASWQTIGPVSVSQNTSTGGVNINIGNESQANLAKQNDLMNAVEGSEGYEEILNETLASAPRSYVFEFDIFKGESFILAWDNATPNTTFIDTGIGVVSGTTAEYVLHDYVLPTESGSVEFVPTIDAHYWRIFIQYSSVHIVITRKTVESKPIKSLRYGETLQMIVDNIKPTLNVTSNVESKTNIGDKFICVWDNATPNTTYISLGIGATSSAMDEQAIADEIVTTKSGYVVFTASVEGNYWRAFISNAPCNISVFKYIEDSTRLTEIEGRINSVGANKIIGKTNTELQAFPSENKADQGDWTNVISLPSANGIIINCAKDATIKVFVNDTNNSTWETIGFYDVSEGINTIYFDKYVELGRGRYIGVDAPRNVIYYVSTGGVGIVGYSGWEVSYNVFTYVSGNESKFDILQQIQANSGLADNSLTWLAIGDSFTEIDDKPQYTGYRLHKGYMTRVCEQIPQLVCTNAGHSGCTFADAYNYTEIVGGYDIYTILFGTNDFAITKVLGTQADFTNRTAGTILGNFGRLYQKVYDLANGAPILVITSTAFGVDCNVSSGTPNHDSTVPNSEGLYLSEMQAAIIAACESENIPYVDVFNQSNMSAKNAMKFARVLVDGVATDLRYPDFLPYVDYSIRPNPYMYPIESVWTTYDGTHPSDLGMQIIAELIIPKMRELLFSRINP